MHWCFINKRRLLEKYLFYKFHFIFKCLCNVAETGNCYIYLLLLQIAPWPHIDNKYIYNIEVFLNIRQIQADTWTHTTSIGRIWSIQIVLTQRRPLKDWESRIYTSHEEEHFPCDVIVTHFTYIWFHTHSQTCKQKYAYVYSIKNNINIITLMGGM